MHWALPTPQITLAIGSNWEVAHQVSYTKYNIQCHMVFYVTMVTFRTTLLMHKWTNIFMDDG
jgi:hypothetical protein